MNLVMPNVTISGPVDFLGLDVSSSVFAVVDSSGCLSSSGLKAISDSVFSRYRSAKWYGVGVCRKIYYYNAHNPVDNYKV